MNLSGYGGELSAVSSQASSSPKSRTPGTSGSFSCFRTGVIDALKEWG